MTTMIHLTYAHTDHKIGVNTIGVSASNETLEIEISQGESAVTSCTTVTPTYRINYNVNESQNTRTRSVNNKWVEDKELLALREYLDGIVQKSRAEKKEKPHIVNTEKQEYISELLDTEEPTVVDTEKTQEEQVEQGKKEVPEVKEPQIEDDFW